MTEFDDAPSRISRQLFLSLGCELPFDMGSLPH